MGIYFIHSFQSKFNFMSYKFILLVFLCPLMCFSQTFTGGTGPINDNQTIDIPIVVSGLGITSIDTNNFGLETICFDITHTWDADLEVSIVSPDGTSALLFAGIGNDGDGFQNTCLEYDASNSIANGSAPFSGTFKPTGQMGLVNNGQNPNGTWYLRVHDNYNQDQGTVNSCSITFGTDPAKYFDFKSSDLPIVIINTQGQLIVDEPKITVDLGIIYNGEGNRNYLSDAKNNYDGKAGIEIRGHYSSTLPQKSYSIELQDDLGNELNASLLGLPSEHDWLLLTNYNDKSFSRNNLPLSIFDSMGHYSPRNRFVDVVINGEYKGIYTLCEKIKRDANRIDIATLNSDEIVGHDVSGGYIVKFDYWATDDSWQLEHSPIGYPGLDIHMVYYYPKPANIVLQQKTYIQNYINELEDALYGNLFDDPSFGYAKYINVGSFIDYFIISELTRNGDGYKKSRYFSKDKDHADGSYRKLKAGPVWDFDWSQKDLSQGSEDGSGFKYLSVNEDVHSPGWYIRLLQDTVFANSLRCRYDDLRRTLLSQEYIFGKIDSVATAVNESQNWHFIIWGNLGSATGTWEVQPPSQTYAEEIQKLKNWYTRRLTWLDNNMPGTLNGCSMAGINSIHLQQAIDVYPLPFTNFLHIDIPAELQEIKEIHLIDASGRMMSVSMNQFKEIAPNAFLLDQLDDLDAGIYWLEIFTTTEKFTKKLVK
jgi:subtilisin-like proprotein convertase family protein